MRHTPRRTRRPAPGAAALAGLAARRIRDEADVRDVIAMMRLNDERIVARHGPGAAA